MKFEDIPFSVVDWKNVAHIKYSGKIGESYWRTNEIGNVRVRIVEYSPGYVADHWCSRGHVVYVLEGELHTELKDGRKFILKEGQSYQVADDDKNPHMSTTEKGAKLFIVD